MSIKDSGKRFRRLLARDLLYLCSLTVSILPKKWLYRFAVIVSGLAYSLAAKQRNIALESLDIAFGVSLKRSQKEKIAKDCFKNMAKSGIEVLHMLRYPETTRDTVRIEGRQYLDQALKKNKGVIMVSAHFGNFPLCLTRLGQEGYKVNVILRRMRDTKVEDFLDKHRRLIGISFIHSAPRQLCVDNSLKALRNNELLFIQLDQNFGTAGVFVKFFSKEAATATGPVVFALRTEAPIIPVFIVRDNDDSHTVIIEPEVGLERKDTQDETLRWNIQKITDIIEAYIRRYPQEWGWIHRRWKSRPA